MTHAIQWEQLALFFMNMEVAISPDDAMLHVGPMTHASGNYILPHFLRSARDVILPRFDPTLVLERRTPRTDRCPVVAHPAHLSSAW